VVLRAGGESQGFFIIQAGELDVLVTAAEGGEHRVSTLGPGEFFGEAALLNRTPITATVRSRTAVELLRLPPAHFYSLLGTGTAAVSATLDQVQSRRAKERLRVAQTVTAGREA
jgi:glutaminase